MIVLGAEVVSIATMLLRADFPIGFLILLGIAVVLTVGALFAVLVEVGRERRQHKRRERR
jgi:uncharacterized integral membrane protein